MTASELPTGPLSAPSHICWGVVDENLILFNPSDRRLHVLNNTAAMVWAMADGTTDVDGLLGRIATEYGVPIGEIDEDVREVTGRLVDAGLCCAAEVAETLWQPPLPLADRGPDLPSADTKSVIGPYDAMGVAVVAVVPDKELRAELERALAPLYSPDMDVTTAAGRLLYTVDRDELGLNLLADGEYIARGTTRPLALRALLSDINSGVLRFVDDALVLHAAAANVRGSLIVMPGAPNSGKSTLVAQLVERGAAYLTDEAVSIGHADGRARPFHKSICVERGSQQRLAHLAPTGGSDARSSTWDVDPRTIGAGMLDPGGEVGALVFPIYRPHTPTPIFRKIEPIESMHRLLANSFDFSSVGQPGFAVLIRLANTVPAYELAHGGENHLGLIEELARAQSLVGSSS